MNQSAWIKILDQMGYRKTMLLEIPLPNGNAGIQFPKEPVAKKESALIPVQ